MSGAKTIPDVDAKIALSEKITKDTRVSPQTRHRAAVAASLLKAIKDRKS